MRHPFVTPDLCAAVRAEYRTNGGAYAAACWRGAAAFVRDLDTAARLAIVRNAPDGAVVDADAYARTHRGALDAVVGTGAPLAHLAHGILDYLLHAAGPDVVLGAAVPAPR